MKVIGLTKEGWEREYVAIVTHRELQGVSDKRYGDNQLKQLNVGDSFDLGAGADFRDIIKAACADMRDAMKSFESARQTMSRFAVMIASADQPAKNEAAA
jgi:hypothetical protein